jgi:hypothetical protein
MEFEGQHEGEEVLFFFRQHPIILRKPLILLLIVWTTTLMPFSFFPLNKWTQIIAGAGFLIGIIVFVYYWVSWYYSLYIVTDLRIIQDQKGGLFSRQVVELDLDKVQNINYEINGISASLFQFGTIVIQTFVGDLVIEKVHHPGKIHQKLTSILRDYEAEEI